MASSKPQGYYICPLKALREASSQSQSSEGACTKFVEKMVTGLQSYNTSPASGFPVSFNEETSPHYTE
ncbi:hypothetical protein NQZ68_017735 [Dissostichus eleginoides]|nr:hypothetical protein NQZ68_017735 [Dissostichus eleginoides]